MSVLARYIRGRFLAPFGFGIGVFALVVFLGDLFDKMHHLVGSRASAWTIGAYLGLSIPYWTIRIVPMATLLATLFAVTGFIQSGEFIGVQASGLRPRDFFRPVLLLSAAVALGSFALQETLLPVCYRNAKALWRENIHPEWEWDRYHDAILVVGPDRFVTTPVFIVKQGLMERPVMDHYGPRGLARQVDAQKAVWDPAAGRWVFLAGVERTFSAQGVAEASFERLVSELAEPPKALVPRAKEPDSMSILELREEMARASRLGQSLYPLRTALQGKLAYPLANVVLCAFGIPIALRLRRLSRPVSFGVALLVCFLYLWLMETGRALGASGRVSAAAAAWVPHLVFGAAALGLNLSSEI